MRIQVTPMAALRNSERNEWIRLLKAEPALANPFLHPAFVEAADRELQPARVAIAESDSGQRAFLAFCDEGRNAAPVAEGLNEQQGLVAPSQMKLPGAELLKAIGAQSLRFDHLLTEQADTLGVWTTRVGGSPQADLASGYDAYVMRKKVAGTSTIRATERKERKLIREVGPLEFQLHDASQEAFDCLIRWKQQQHIRTGIPDLFADTSVVRFLERIRLLEDDGCRARFSVLRANGSPIAVHLGLFSDQVGHVWYPAYDTSLRSYSPGLILLLKMMREISEQGVRTLDFGPGPQRYKQSLKTHDRSVCIGTVDQSSFVSALRLTVHHAKRLVKRTPLESLRRIAATPFKWPTSSTPQST